MQKIPEGEAEFELAKMCTRERSPIDDEMLVMVAPQAETGTNRFAGKEDTGEAVFFVDTATSNTMVSTEFQVSRHMVDKVDFNILVHIKPGVEGEVVDHPEVACDPFLTHPRHSIQARSGREGKVLSKFRPDEYVVDETEPDYSVSTDEEVEPAG